MLKFRFGILDLLVMTGVVAAIAASFRTDLTFFRQLMCVGITAACATASIMIFTGSKRTQRVAIIGGVVGGGVFFAGCFLFRNWIYDVDYNMGYFSPVGPWVDIISDFVANSLIAVPLGVALGPIVALRFRTVPLPNEFAQPFWTSIALAGGVTLLALFATFERKSMNGREWDWLLLVVSIAFVIQSFGWIRRLEVADACEGIETGRC